MNRRGFIGSVLALVAAPAVRLASPAVFAGATVPTFTRATVAYVEDWDFKIRNVRVWHKSLDDVTLQELTR